MSSHNGRGYLAIPGPSVMPDAVLQAMHRPSPNIYAGELIEITDSLVPDLKAVARTQQNAAIYIGNGHAAWEAALANTIAPGEKVLLLSTGNFGAGWGHMATRLGAEVEVIDFGKRTPIDLDVVAERLRVGCDFKAVMTVHVDTSSSTKSDIAGVRRAMDEAKCDALLLSDCIASLGCDEFQFDDWGVDVMVAGCQKGLMTPAGISFVFFSEKAAKVQKKLDRVSPYWDWAPRVNPDLFYQYFCGTAPTHHIYGLRAALDIIGAEGIENVWSRHATLARSIWAACDAWGANGPMELNVANPEHRSNAVTSVRIGAPYGTQLREWCEENVGVTLGIGLGMAEPDDPEWHGFFRFGHMGHLNGQMIMGLLGSVQAGLSALDIPHGAGALDAAASVLAQTSAPVRQLSKQGNCCG